MSDSNATNFNKRHSPNSAAYTAVVRVDSDGRKDENIASENGEESFLTKGHSEIPRIPEQGLWEKFFSWRSVMVALLHVCYVNSMMYAIILPMALICMCGPIRVASKDTLNNTISFSSASPYEESTVSSNGTFFEKKMYEFSWDSETQGLLISAYLFTVFLGPQLSNFVRGYIGNRLTLTLFNMILAFLCMLSPFAARTSVYFLLVIRIISGFFIDAGVIIGADTLAWWLPAKEKLTSVTIVVTGWITGNALSPFYAGYFCDVPVDNGWPIIFYFSGIFITAWSIAWYYLSSRKPEDHPYISEKEKAYIIAHRTGMSHMGSKEAEKPPYLTILKSPVILAYVAYRILHLWAFIAILTCIPAYLTSSLKFSIQDAGVIIAVMSGLRIPAALLWSELGNCLMRFKSMNTNKARKICFALAQGLSGVFSIGAALFDDSQKWAATTFMVISALAVTFGSSMSSVIPLDVAPRYAGFVTGYSSSASLLVSITAPLVVSAITAKGSYEEWRTVWIIMAVVHFMAGVVFVVFGNASIQPWALPTTKVSSNTAQNKSSSDEKQFYESVPSYLTPMKSQTQ